MSTDYRALCEQLMELAEGKRYDGSAVIAKARAALAQPEPQAPTDEALVNFSGWFCRNYPGPDTIIHKPEWHAPKVFRAAAYAIARYGAPANTINQED
jgi:hypothetical protein